MALTRRYTSALCSAVALLMAPGSILIAGCRAQRADEQDYVTYLTTLRTERNTKLVSGPRSPVPASHRSQLLPLAYFPIDPHYRVPASLKPVNGSNTATLSTSTGRVRTLGVAGLLVFVLNGE